MNDSTGRAARVRMAPRAEIVDQSTIVVACTLRSGSNLLCEILRRLGFGLPREYFQQNVYLNAISARAASGRQERSLSDVCAEFLAEQSDGAWRGVKWNWLQFSALDAALQADPRAPRFDELFPRARWIRLERRDKVAQAVSLVIARRNGVWVHGDIANVATNLTYDFDEIFEVFQDLNVEEQFWSSHLAQLPEPPVQVYFEDLIADMEAESRRIVKALGAGGAERRGLGELFREPLENQPTGTALHAEFVQRFYADLARNRRPRTYRNLEGMLTDLSRVYEGWSKDQVLIAFLGDQRGRFPELRKLRIDETCRLSGEVTRVEEPHFLDGVAYRLEPGSSLELEVECDSLLIQLLMHPWSGELEIDFDGAVQRFDLYHPVTSSKPVMHRWDRPARRRVSIRPTLKHNPLAQGVETWVQQVWTLCD